MQGHVLGHTPAIPLSPIPVDGAITAVSGELNPYEELALAHAERRKAMHDSFKDVEKALLESLSNIHEMTAQVQSHIHIENAALEQTAPADHRPVQDQWMRAHHDKDNHLKIIERAAGAKRKAARELARNIVDQARKEAALVRKNANLRNWDK